MLPEEILGHGIPLAGPGNPSDKAGQIDQVQPTLSSFLLTFWRLFLYIFACK
jgi:hypothetical protein